MRKLIPSRRSAFSLFLFVILVGILFEFSTTAHRRTPDEQTLFGDSNYQQDQLDGLCRYSALWGKSGEQWTATGRLPDFSYAGYKAGESPIPSPKPIFDLKRDFHAVGDGKADDTAALELAMQSIKAGVLFIPKGTYVISKQIDIARGNLIIRGAGQNETILYFPHSLTDLKGNNARGNGTSQWSFGPGLINFKGSDPITPKLKLASITAVARRGDKTLELSGPIKVSNEDWIRIVESDPAKGEHAGSLIKHLYGDLMPAGAGLVGTDHVVRFLTRIKHIDGNRLELERPLPYDIRLEWTPEIYRFAPAITEVGLEHLSIHFPLTPYPGHFKEAGFNALFFDDLAQSWIRDVEIQNSDIGISLNGTNFCTVSDVVLTTSSDRATALESRGWNGHHGIDVGHGTENLITNFDVRTKFVHDISIEWYGLHTVYSNGRGIDLNMDHHREANYSSLFTQIDCGKCTRPFDSGGSNDRGAHSGAYNTYWNISQDKKVKFPAQDFGPLLNFFAVGDATKFPQSPFNWFFEPPGTITICPSNLYDAMRKRRLGH